MSMLIDAHIHYFDAPGWTDKLIADMDEAGISWSVLLPTIGESVWEYVGMTFHNVANVDVLREIKRYPDRLVGGIRLIPTEAGAVDALRRYADTGHFRLAKFSPPEGFRVDDERILPFYEVCAQYKLPVLIHMGQTGGDFIGAKKAAMYQLNSSLGNPMHLDYAAKMFPELTFIIAHNGYPYFIESWAVALENPNVCLDISGSGPWVDGMQAVYAAMGGAAFIPIDFNRVWWGSDNCLPQRESISRATVFMRQMGAGKTQRARIFGGLAQELLHLG